MNQFINDLKVAGLNKGMLVPEQVAIVLRNFAEWFSFENVDVICRNEDVITPEFLKKKMVESRRGGLCYEMNALLYLLLKELGFDSELCGATVYNGDKWALDRTHAMVLLTIDGNRYVADGGFGSKLALSPMPLDGSEVTSPAGTFRVRTMKTEKGSIALECLTNEGVWRLQYAFDWVPMQWQELTRMKQDIHHHPGSAFNKQLLIAKVLPDGTQSLNEDRLHRKWVDGMEETTAFATKDEMIKTIRRESSPAIAEEVEKYVGTSHHPEN